MDKEWTNTSLFTLQYHLQQERKTFVTADAGLKKTSALP